MPWRPLFDLAAAEIVCDIALARSAIPERPTPRGDMDLQGAVIDARIGLRGDQLFL
jgi:hypothetical protein